MAFTFQAEIHEEDHSMIYAKRPLAVGETEKPNHVREADTWKPMDNHRKFQVHPGMPHTSAEQTIITSLHGRRMVSYENRTVAIGVKPCQGCQHDPKEPMI